MVDATYEIIYGVIVRKFRALTDRAHLKCENWLWYAYISKKYCRNCLFHSLKSTDAWTPRVLLVDMILYWPMLYIAWMNACIAHMLYYVCTWGTLCCRLSSPLWLRHWSVPFPSTSSTSQPHLGDRGTKRRDWLCTHYIDNLLPYAQYTIQLMGMW